MTVQSLSSDPALGPEPALGAERPDGPDQLALSTPWQPTCTATRPDILVSFEFFPPKNETAEQQLWSAIERLAPLWPQFVSVTYGAGGSTRERTKNTVVRIRKETDLEPAAHLTCVNATKEEIDDIAREYWDAGIRHILALRGDPPGGVGKKYEPHPGGYAYASDLVEGLKKVHNFEISVAAYPDVHPEASSPGADLDALKRKIDAGADRAITQYFFDVNTYLRFLERCRAAGITVPIIPGLIPVTNFATVRRFSEACGTVIPDWLTQAFDGLEDDPETRRMVATAILVEQVQALIANGQREFHFYTLNRADLVFSICHLLGIRPVPHPEPAAEQAS